MLLNSQQMARHAEAFLTLILEESDLHRIDNMSEFQCVLLSGVVARQQAGQVLLGCTASFPDRSRKKLTYTYHLGK